MLQRLGIVHPQILDVQHRVVLRLQNLQRGAQGWRVGPREDLLTDPAAEDSWTVASDEVHQAAPGVSDAAVNHIAKLGQMRLADVLQHAHRYEYVEGSRNGPIMFL